MTHEAYDKPSVSQASTRERVNGLEKNERTRTGIADKVDGSEFDSASSCYLRLDKGVVMLKMG